MRIRLRYGKKSFYWEDSRLTPRLVQPLESNGRAVAVPHSIGEDFEHYLAGGKDLLVVAPDVTRHCGLHKLFHLILRHAAAAGIPESKVKVLFANGLHRELRIAEMKQILGLLTGSDCVLVNHNARESRDLVSLGHSPKGIKVEVNRAIVEADRILLTGAIGFHYLAGYSGGWKIVVPGVASHDTILAFHKLTLEGGPAVGLGRTQGNPFFEEIHSLGKLLQKPCFAVNTVLAPDGRLLRLFSGDVAKAFREGCDFYRGIFERPIQEKADLAVVSCGGFPKDINLIQAHKAIESGVRAISPGGTLILLAECPDGFGHPQFLEWFAHESSSILYSHLKENFHVYARTAWSILKKTEEYRVLLVSALKHTELLRTGLVACSSLKDALYYSRKMLGSGKPFYVIPEGSWVLPSPEN